MMVFTATQSGSLRVPRSSDFFSAGKTPRTPGEIVAVNVREQAHFACGGDGALQHENQVFGFLAFPRIGSGLRYS